jgi:hypothetical protein
MKKKIGRPYEPNCVRRTGKVFIVWLSKEDSKLITISAKDMKISKSELFRKLIRKLRLPQYHKDVTSRLI